MAALVIFISLDVSVESVGSSFLRVILIGSISVEIPVALEVGAAIVSSPARVLELDTRSSSKVDPSESSPPLVSVALMVLPFMCSDDSESDTKIPERHVSPTTCIPEIPTTPILPAPSTVDIPIGRLYRTHPGGPCRALTARRSVRPLLSHRLALRYTSHHLDHFTSGSSSIHSSSDHSSFGSTPLSTMYPPMTSESSVGDSSSESSTGPSRKRCRSPATTMTSFIRAMRALVHSRADLFPPRKRFRDYNSPKDSVEEDIDTDVLEDIETGQRELESRSLIAGVERASLLAQVASFERSNVRRRGTMMMERARADRFQRCVRFMESELRQICRFCYYDRIRFRRLEKFAVTRAANALEAESQSQNGSDNDNGNGGNGNGGAGNGRYGNGGNGNGGNGNPNENNRDARPIAR
ncbi:hypothetical protein Tco_1431427, partial [Tanacetum coccineum]